MVDPLLYSGFVEELVEVLELKQPNLHVRTYNYMQHWPIVFDVLGGEGQLFEGINCHDTLGERSQAECHN